MKVIGLTGGIGTGKSTVAQYFSDLGVDIVDADVIARDIVIKREEVAARIIQHFGGDVINEQGKLDRRQLRKRIFQSAAEREWLENLLHPLIREEIKQRVQTISSPYCIVVVPLLQGVISNPLFDRVLVIDAPFSLRVTRTQERDNSETQEVIAIMEAQYSREDYLKAADDVITNNSSLEALQSQVKALHNYYLSL